MVGKLARTILARKVDDSLRAEVARRRGYDTFIAADGSVRLARDVPAGESVIIPSEHLERIRKSFHEPQS
jgi:hypothetical protein